ncbi:MAG: iron ABC transporter permease [Lachnospiraceae bacterium]|nr:iron ABC transporter permease [Lachnospiraceae bacterium]
MRNKTAASYALLVLGTGLLVFLNMVLGTAAPDDPSYQLILTGIRLPRLLAALVLGGALAVSGYLLQVFFGNPIAGPFVLGISNGARLMTAAALIVLMSGGVHLSALGLVGASFVGAGAVTIAVLVISRHTGKMSVLILAGVMIGYICNALTDFLITFADDRDIVNLHNWTMGSFSGMSLKTVGIAAAITFVGMAGCVALIKPVGAYLTGEEYARSVGVNITVFRLMLILVSSLLSATVTAFAGPVSFVGVAVPHMMRKIFGTTVPAVMIPACFLGGAAFCLLSDMIARLAFSPTELSLSSVTAILGAPVVIAVLLGKNR